SGAIKRFEDVIANTDKEVFDPEINDINFGKKITGGDNNYGLWEVTKYRGQPRNDLIAKFFRGAHSLEYGEVKALKMMNLLVGSGKTKDPHPERESLLLPVIIMKKKEGVTCFQYVQNSNEDHLFDMWETQEMMCKQAAKDAVNFRVFHELLCFTIDNSIDNGFVTTDKGSAKVELIDYGDAYMVIDESIPEETFYKACIGR
ncbi:hypothetical protein GGU10DRAFT_335538, partial [Lentinula aff. detonsa]